MPPGARWPKKLPAAVPALSDVMERKDRTMRGLIPNLRLRYPVQSIQARYREKSNRKLTKFRGFAAYTLLLTPAVPIIPLLI